jgi:RimJ/RimL family protein N-acetyltransferase
VADISDLLRCPMMQTLAYAERLLDAPRRVQDSVLLWNAQMRCEGLTDVDFFDGHEELVYALGWTPVYPLQPVLGALVWRTLADSSWWTMLGWVDPVARNQGLYTMLWEACVHRAREAKVRRIQGGSHVTNKRMHRLMERLGRKPHSVIYDYEVEQ